MRIKPSAKQVCLFLICFYFAFIVASCASNSAKKSNNGVTKITFKKVITRIEGKVYCGEEQEMLSDKFSTAKLAKVELLLGEQVIGSALTISDGSFSITETLSSNTKYELRATSDCGTAQVKISENKKPLLIKNIFIKPKE